MLVYAGGGFIGAEAISDLPPEQQPYVLEARRRALRERAEELTHIVLTLVEFVDELQVILDQREIPEVRDLLNRIGQQGLHMGQLAEDLFTALDRHYGRAPEDQE